MRTGLDDPNTGEMYEVRDGAEGIQITATLLCASRAHELADEIHRAADFRDRGRPWSERPLRQERPRDALTIALIACERAARDRFPTDQDAAARYIGDLITEWANAPWPAR